MILELETNETQKLTETYNLSNCFLGFHDFENQNSTKQILSRHHSPSLHSDIMICKYSEDLK